MIQSALSLCLFFALLFSASAQLLPPDFLLPIPPPRIDLSTTNSAPMQLREMSVSASVRGLYATVNTTLSFHNPNSRPLEGELFFPLPDGAAVCGYALDINGVLTDGVVVKKEKARIAFESETRRQIDPGIVEHIKGNLYRTRIFPLPPHGIRTLRLSYTTPLLTASNGDAALLIPMPREPIEKLSIKIEVAVENTPTPELGGLGDLRFQQAENVWRVESTITNATPSEDVWVALPQLPQTLSSVEKVSETSVWFSISAVPLFSPKDVPQVPSKLHILWDASGSRASADLQKEYDLIASLKSAALDLIVFRDAPEALIEFTSPADLVAALKKIPFDGGSDFASLSSVIPNDGEPNLLFTDGIDTLSAKPIEWGDSKVMAIVSQTMADREALRQACAGALIDLQTTDQTSALAQIYNPSPRIVGVKGTGIANVQGLGRPASGRVTLIGQLTAPEATIQIQYSSGMLSEPFTLRTEGAHEGQTLATAWAAARVNQLSPRADQFEDDLLSLGRQYGLVSPAASLIVLESLDQWIHHEIEPPASLPEMRAQYYASLKSRGQETTDTRTRHLEQLASLWKQRVDWWKTDFSKNPLPVPEPKERTPHDIVEMDPVEAPPSPAPMEMHSMARSVTLEYSAMASPMVESARDEKTIPPDTQPSSSIEIKEWNPDTPYLKAIRKASDPPQRYAAYLAERKDWSQSPAFFLDCAEEFLKQQDKILGLRILSNLAELKIEDAALLRVFAWRLQQADEMDRAILLLRRVAKLRAEEPQSFRDLALALAKRGKSTINKTDLEEAMNLFLKVALTPWNRHEDSIPLFALEELNALIAWIHRQEWKDGDKPAIPDYDEKLRDNLDTDIRIVMSWDADATDIDLHVVEPGGEEAFYGHNRTARGGLVSRDITDGYGPEEYLIHTAPHGMYAIQAKYYGSRQQTLVGAATATATVFTDRGRANEKLQTLTLRLDQPQDKIDIGSILFGSSHDSGTVHATPHFSSLRPGMTQEEVVTAVGNPTQRDNQVWVYGVSPRLLSVHFDAHHHLLRVVETLPGGIENIVVQ